jgi:hypothetical protein
VPADLNFQQTLLVMRSDAERTGTLLDYYRSVLPKLRSSAKGAGRAPSNLHIM